MSCPSFYTIYENKCLSPCNQGYVEYPGSPYYCVSTFPCPTGTSPSRDIKLCVKNNLGPPNPATGCPINQMEWIHSQCMINCQFPLLEDVTDCLQTMVLRQTMDPDCKSSFYTWKNTKCERNENYYFLVLVLIVISAYLIYIFLKED